jgi:hypothetical protein
VVDLIDRCEFDTIYHEHLCYFSVTTLDRLFRRHGLFLNRVARLSIHGGSLRLVVEPTEAPESSVTDLLHQEQRLGVDRFDYYHDFGGRVERVRTALVDLLGSLRREGRSIAAYGAAAKGATLLNYSGIGADVLDFVVDRNTHKHGKLMPGAHIPIVDTSRLASDLPDFTLLLAWNFADEVILQQADYRRRGGRFIVPIPEPHIV